MSADRLFTIACAVLEPAQWRGNSDLLARIEAPEGWDRVLQLAKRHALYGLLARSLGWARDEVALQVPILAELQDLRKQLLAQNLGRKVELQRVGLRLEQRGIPFVPVKGAVLAAEVFGDLSLRTFVDHDILVPDDRIEDAEAAVAELGYQSLPYRDRENFRKTGHQNVPLVRSDGAMVELHWNLLEPRVHRADPELVWANCQSAPPGSDLPGLRLSPALTMVHLAGHFAQHDFLEFRFLVDFYVACAVLGPKTSAREVMALSRRIETTLMVELAARLCAGIFPPTKIIDDLVGEARALRSRLVHRLLTPARLLHPPAPRNILNRALQFALISSPSAASKAAFRVLVPEPEALEIRFGRPFTPLLYPMHYLRQIRWKLSRRHDSE